MAPSIEDKSKEVPVQHLLTHRPEAVLALVPRTAVMFLAGGLSGAVARSITAPIDRIKILLQVTSFLIHSYICTDPSVRCARSDLDRPMHGDLYLQEHVSP